MYWNSDMFIAVCTVSPPVSGYSVWDSGPLRPVQQSEMRAYPEMTRHGAIGLALLELGDSLDQDMSTIVNKVVNLAQTAQYFWTCPGPLADRTWICMRSEALMLTLLSSSAPTIARRSQPLE